MTATRSSKPRSRLAAALRAVQRGWPVFPLHPYSKCPAVRDWPHRATCDLAELTRWWAVAPYNIGIACQAAGLVVLDLDTGHGDPPPPWARLGVTHGRDVLRILAERAGQPDPIDTYTVATPSGGEHRYFLAPPDHQLRTTSAALGWKIDTRATGGAIIAAGSVRRVEGRPRLYRVVRDINPIPLPHWLVTALTPLPAPLRPPIPLPTPGGRLDAYVTAALDGETTAVTQAAPSTRAHILFRAAARLGELVGVGVLDETVATETLLAAAPVLDNGTDRFTRREAEGHITNGIARGRRNPPNSRDRPPDWSGRAGQRGFLRSSGPPQAPAQPAEDSPAHAVVTHWSSRGSAWVTPPWVTFPQSLSACVIIRAAGWSVSGPPEGQHTGRGQAARNPAHPPG